MNKDRWIIEAGILFLILILGAIYTDSNFNAPRNIPPSPTYEVADIGNMVEITKLDHARFDRDYAQHKFSGTMQLDQISEIKNTYVLSFKRDSQSDFPQVMCRADQSFTSNPINEHVGEQVYVSGIINYAFMGSIALNDCEYAVVAK